MSTRRHGLRDDNRIGSRICCRDVRGMWAGPRRTTACWWTRCCTGIARGYHGGSCPDGSATSAWCSRGSAVGRRAKGEARGVGKGFQGTGRRADPEYAMIDRTIVRARPHSAGALKKTVRRRSGEARGACAPKSTPRATPWATPRAFT